MEGIVDDVRKGRFPNIFTELGCVRITVRPFSKENGGFIPMQLDEDTKTIRHRVP